MAAMRKRNRNNWLALQVQLFRQGGGKVAEVAEQFGCSTRNIFKLSRRKFPRIVLVVLCRVLNVNVPKGSGGSVHQKHPGTGIKETLRTVSLDEGAGVARPAVRCSDRERDEIDRIGLQICDLLRAHWAT